MFFWGGGGHLEDLDITVKIILKWFIKRCDAG